MNKLTLSIAGFLIVSLASPTVLALDADAVASVNGEKITQEQYKSYLKQRASQVPRGKQAPANRLQVIDELINRKILLQEARKLKLHKNKKVLAQIKQQRNNILIQALFSRSPASKPITDKELKKFYLQRISNVDPREFKARHILVKKEAKAKELIEKLNNGADFEELAKTESTGPSGKNGGDLGWFSAEKMVPAFSKATAKMKKGTHSQTPVKTGFGYHIIKLESTRKRQVPKFEDVKNKIKPMIQNQRVQEYMVKLRNKAKIEIR